MSSNLSTIHQEVLEEIDKNNIVFWRGHVEAYQKTALSKRSYAKKHELIYHQFVYWCRKVSLEIAETIKPEFGFIQIKREKESNHLKVLGTLELGKEKRLLIHEESILLALVKS